MRAPRIAVHSGFNRQAEWGDPQHELLHVRVWQDVKRERGIGDTRSARLVFHPTHNNARAACSDQLLLVVVASNCSCVGCASIESARCGELDTWSGCSNCQRINSRLCWMACTTCKIYCCAKLRGGLVVCGDYFGAMPSFKSCAVSAEAVVEESVRGSAKRLQCG